MFEWWPDISGLNQAFYIAAAFFSCVFLWQFIASMIGLAGGDMDFDADIDADAIESMSAFKMLSLRAILAFCTLFSWAGALYLDRDYGLTPSLLYALLWGVVALVVVAGIFHMMLRLTESGTPRLATCVGKNGTVYLDIPDGGRGEIRIPVSGVMAHVKARVADGKALKMGTAIRVRRLLDSGTVEIESISSDKSNSDS